MTAMFGSRSKFCLKSKRTYTNSFGSSVYSFAQFTVVCIRKSYNQRFGNFMAFGY